MTPKEAQQLAEDWIFHETAETMESPSDVLSLADLFMKIAATGNGKGPDIHWVTVRDGDQLFYDVRINGTDCITVDRSDIADDIVARIKLGLGLPNDDEDHEHRVRKMLEVSDPSNE